MTKKIKIRKIKSRIKSIKKAKKEQPTNIDLSHQQESSSSNLSELEISAKAPSLESTGEIQESTDIPAPIQEETKQEITRLYDIGRNLGETEETRRYVSESTQESNPTLTQVNSPLLMRNQEQSDLRGSGLNEKIDVDDRKYEEKGIRRAERTKIKYPWEA